MTVQVKTLAYIKSFLDNDYISLKENLEILLKTQWNDCC